VNVIVVGTGIGAASDLDGNFLITGLEPGFYTLMGSFIGYKLAYSASLEVNNARSVYVEIPMEQVALEFEQVEVRPSAFKKIAETPLSIQKIQVTDIEKAPGANRDISRVIQSFPGVGSTVSFRNDVIVRGGGPSESRFFLDGIEIPNLNHFATQGASGGPVGIINPDFIESVDYYSGAFPANRANALSGIFDFKQKSGNQERTNRRAVVGASELALTMDGPLNTRTTYLASVRRSYLQFLFDAIGLPFLPTFNDYQIKTETNFDPQNRLVIVSLGALDQNRLNLAIRQPTDEQQYILNYLPESDQWNYMIGAAYTRFSGNRFQTWVLSRNMLNNESYKFQNNDRRQPDNQLLDYRSREIENKFRFENTLRAEGLRLNYGLNLEYVKYSNNTFQKLFINNAPVTKNYDSAIDLIKWGFFIQASRPFLRDRLRLSVGLRGDANSFAAAMANPLDQLSPRLSVAYILTENLNLNASTGIFYQLPPYTSIGYRDSNGNLVNRNNNLQYIRAAHWIGGIEYVLNRDSRITLEGFYKQYRQYPFSVTDSIAIANKGGDFGSIGDEEVISTGAGRAYGAELAGRYRTAGNLSLIFAYTFVRSEFDNWAGEAVPSSWDSRHILTLTGTRPFRKTWQAGFKLRYVGGLPYTPYDLEKSALVSAWETQGRPFWDFSRFNTARFDPFVQLDLRLDRSFYFADRSLLVYLDIQNALNFKSRLPDIVIPAVDPNGQPVIIDEGTPNARYVLRSLPNTAGTLLPTIGITFDF